jgi:hypothetical protein
MPLPNADQAIVPAEKLTNYLLSETHPVGKLKARFFRSLGYDERNVDLLREQLREIARSGVVSKKFDPSPYGTKYIVDGQLISPTGGQVLIRTVWVIEPGQPPRFVTAYPL